MINGKTLVLGVTGGIAVYKVPDLISRLRKKQINVEVIMTRSAAEFVTPLTFREISQNPVHMDMFTDDFQWKVEHIALAQKAEAIAIIPATANIIAKFAAGIADDLLTTTVLAAACPKLIAPAMNSGMFQNPIFQRNLSMIAEFGFTVVGPDSGHLLCGTDGIGRLANLDEIERNILRLLTKQDLKSEIVLITAGGTKEPIDPVRYIGNRSSGKMGHALAETAYYRGAKVMLVTTVPEHAPHAENLEVYPVSTVAEMYTQVKSLAKKASIIIKAAAPADYRPTNPAVQKIKKSDSNLHLDLTSNPDILKELGNNKTSGQLLIGFAAETESLSSNALKKLNQKNVDLIFGNLVNQPNIGIGADSNKITVFSKNDSLELEEMPKTVLADRLWNIILKYKQEQVLSD